MEWFTTSTQHRVIIVNDQPSKLSEITPFPKIPTLFCVCSRLLRWGWIQMNDDVWIVTTPIISRLFSLLVINQQSNSFAMLCDESTWNKSLELCSRIEQWFDDRWTSAVLYLNYLFINHINGIAADDRRVESLEIQTGAGGNFAKTVFSWISNFTSHRLDLIEFHTLASLKLMTDFSVMISSTAVQCTHLPSLHCSKNTRRLCARETEKLKLENCYCTSVSRE